MHHRILAIDFDGTIVEHKFPEIGDPIPGALEAIRALQDMDFKIILWTVRSNENCHGNRKYLDEAVTFLMANGIKLWGINKNPDQDSWSKGPKVYAQLYVDDSAVGAPKGVLYNWGVAVRHIAFFEPFNMKKNEIKRLLGAVENVI